MNTHTQLVQFDAAPQDPWRPTCTPIYLSATFEQESPERFGDYDYSRSANPTRAVLEKQLATLEHGAGANCFSSGMAAIAAVLGLVRAGEEILAGEGLYGGTFRLFGRAAPRRDIAVRYADAASARDFARHVTARTRLVYIETPSNPRLEVVDIRAVAQALRTRAAELGITPPLLCVDNTMATPYLQQPLLHGADLVVHSATKALCGHGDVTAGAVISRDPAVAREIAFIANAEGSALGPFDSYLLLRGLKTLALRLDRQQATAQRLAEFLARHPSVSRVYFPGLADHPGAAVHAGQCRGPGCVISIEVADAAAANSFARSLKLFPITVSFGSVNSSVSVPANMSHASVPAELRERLAPPPNLVRLSVGIEDAGDLLTDITQALQAAHALPEQGPFAVHVPAPAMAEAASPV